ncbi:MAG: hypothetical protein R2789_09190 [Microthrixaceae bacterium]
MNAAAWTLSDWIAASLVADAPLKRSIVAASVVGGSQDRNGEPVPPVM